MQVNIFFISQHYFLGYMQSWGQFFLASGTTHEMPFFWFDRTVTHVRQATVKYSPLGVHYGPVVIYTS